MSDIEKRYPRRTFLKFSGLVAAGAATSSLVSESGSGEQADICTDSGSEPDVFCFNITQDANGKRQLEIRFESGFSEKYGALDGNNISHFVTGDPDNMDFKTGLQNGLKPGTMVHELEGEGEFVRVGSNVYLTRRFLEGFEKEKQRLGDSLATTGIPELPDGAARVLLYCGVPALGVSTLGLLRALVRAVQSESATPANRELKQLANRQYAQTQQERDQRKGYEGREKIYTINDRIETDPAKVRQQIKRDYRRQQLETAKGMLDPRRR